MPDNGAPDRDVIWHTAIMAWLVCDARVLASAELADTRRARRRGLLGRDRIDGALVIEPVDGSTRSG